MYDMQKCLTKQNIRAYIRFFSVDEAREKVKRIPGRGEHEKPGECYIYAALFKEGVIFMRHLTGQAGALRENSKQLQK